MDRPLDARIREFEEEDLEAVRCLIHRTVDACYAGVYPPRAVRYFKDFHSSEKILRRHREGEILVIGDSTRIIATGAIVGGDIFAVFVAPECQGRGYGRALMEDLENRAKAKGRHEAELSVSLPSRRFYEDLGYEMIEERSIDVGEGQHLEYWHARKRLA